MGHVPHLYIPPPWGGGELDLSASQQAHLLKVLRTGEGEPLSYTDGIGISGSGTLGRRAVVRGDEWPVPRPSDLTVAVAPPSSRSRLRFLVEKLAELGVARLLWIRTRHAEGRPPSPEKAKAWSVSGMEQSRGAWLMEVETTSLPKLDHGRVVVADPAGAQPAPAEGLCLLIGPEGGLDPDEIPARAARITLGPTILRIETAAVVGATLLRVPAREEAESAKQSER